MNPGSSQFASQFPDAEETMSKMESKKLQTVIVNGEACPKIVNGNLLGCIDAWAHDARIAHEQREVIKKLARKLAAATYWANELKFQMSAYKISDDIAEAIKGFNEVLDAAAPYLQED